MTSGMPSSASRSHGFTQRHSLVNDYYSPTGSQDKSPENALFVYIDLLAKSTRLTTGELLHVAYEHMRRIAMKDARKSVIKVTVNPEWRETWGEEGILRRCRSAGPPFDSIIAVQFPLLYNDRVLLVVNSYFDTHQIREYGHLLGPHLDARVWRVEAERFYIVPSNITANNDVDKTKINYKATFPKPMENLTSWKNETGLNIEKAYWKQGNLWLVLQDLAEARAAVSGRVYSLGGFQTRFISKDPRYVPKQCFNCQDFGHMLRQCPNATRCAFCSEGHNTKLCKEEGRPKCATCKGPHPSYDLEKCKDPKVVSVKHDCSLYRGPAEWDAATMDSLLHSGNQTHEQDSPMLGGLFNGGSPGSEMGHNAQVPLNPDSPSIRNSNSVIRHLYHMVTSSHPSSSFDGLNASYAPAQETAAPRSGSPAPSNSSRSSRMSLSEAIERSGKPLNKRTSGKKLMAAFGQMPCEPNDSVTSPGFQPSQDAAIGCSSDTITDTPVDTNQGSMNDPHSDSSHDGFTPVSSRMIESDANSSSDPFIDSAAQPEHQSSTTPHLIATLFKTLSIPETRPDDDSSPTLESSAANEPSVTDGCLAAAESSDATESSAALESLATAEFSGAIKSLITCDSSTAYEPSATSDTHSTPFSTPNSVARIESEPATSSVIHDSFASPDVYSTPSSTPNYNKEVESEHDISSTSDQAQPFELDSSSEIVRSPCRKKLRVWEGGCLSGHLEGNGSLTVRTTSEEGQGSPSKPSVIGAEVIASRSSKNGGNRNSCPHPVPVRTPSPQPKRVCRPWVVSNRAPQQLARNMIQLQLPRPEKSNSDGEIKDTIVCAGAATPERVHTPPKPQPRQIRMDEYIRRERK